MTYKIYNHEEALKKVSGLLNDLLSDYQVYYQNLRGFHWNVRGKDFFEMHAKFEEWYDDAAGKIDEIAERILSLGEKPSDTFEDYIRNSEIKSVSGISNAVDAVKTVLASLEKLLEKEKQILETASVNGDEATVALMSGYIEEGEKFRWMLQAYLD